MIRNSPSGSREIVRGTTYFDRMNISTSPSSTFTGNLRHPERGRRYTIDELRELADQGDAWALCQVDQWEREFANEYAGTLTEQCTDHSCEGFGEPVDVCFGQDGEPIDVDHGDWGHAVSRLRAA